MDRAEFDRAKEWARFFLRHSPMGNKSSGEALLAVTDNGDPSIKTALIAMSFTERWAWDATLAMAQEWLRAEAWIPRQETLPDSVRSPLANWTADVLAKKMNPPPKGGNRLANRDALIAEVVYLLTVLLESVRRLYEGLQSFRSMRRMEASLRKPSALRLSPVLGQPTTAIEPGDGAFNNPALGQHDEALGAMRLTISVSSWGWMPANGRERPALDRRCRRTVLSGRGRGRISSPAARGRRRGPERRRR